MTNDQIILFCLFIGVFAMLLWGRWRYDLIAFVALLVGLVAGVVPTDQAFSGFGHPATVIIALVLVVSRGLMNSGAIDVITRKLIDTSRALGGHIAMMSAVGGVLSAFMNNVAALALLMPVDIQAAKKAGRPPGLTLMPLAFATILGGLVTLIGTPPNIIISQFREDAIGAPFAMFDFAPVGLSCAVIGIAFVALGGWRLIPVAGNDGGKANQFRIEDYVAELIVPEGSPLVDKRVNTLDEEAEELDTVILGLVRGGRRRPGRARREIIQAGDMLVVEATSEAIDRIKGAWKLEFVGEDKHEKAAGGGMATIEVVVPADSRLDGRSAYQIGLLRRQGVTLLGVSRQGTPFRDRIRQLTVKAGDVLLLLGPAERLNDIVGWLGCLPMSERVTAVTQHRKALLATGIFAAGIVLASLKLLYLPVALAIVVAIYVLTDIVPIREIYDDIEWPVIVLLGSMIPLGAALEASGGTALVAKGIIGATSGFGPAIILLVLMVVVMTLSDVLNNTATTVISAPIAVDIAKGLGVHPDPFLMAVAVAASCAFLTPIGHKNNTLIMGPGGYRFGDYWRMGLPLEIIVIGVAVPAILLFWPIQPWTP